MRLPSARRGCTLSLGQRKAFSAVNTKASRARVVIWGIIAILLLVGCFIVDQRIRTYERQASPLAEIQALESRANRYGALAAAIHKRGRQAHLPARAVGAAALPLMKLQAEAQRDAIIAKVRAEFETSDLASIGTYTTYSSATTGMGRLSRNNIRSQIRATMPDETGRQTYHLLVHHPKVDEARHLLTSESREAP